MLKNIPGLKTFSLSPQTKYPHYGYEENQVFSHFQGCCPQITTFEFDPGVNPYGGKNYRISE